MTSPLNSAPLLDLCAALRTLREDRELTLRDVAEATGFSITKVQRMETGRRGLNPQDVAALLTLYEVSAVQRYRLLAVLAEVRQPGWWTAPNVRIPADWRQAIALEHEAAAIRDYDHGVIPPLLQTGGYAGALLRPLHPELDENAVSHLVSARVIHQTIITGAAAPSVHCLIEESALLRPVGGPDVFAQQLRALIDIRWRPNVVVRVVPLDAGAHPGLRGSFTLLEFGRVPPMVRVAGGSRFVRDKPVVRQACSDWAAVEQVALSSEETAALLASRLTAVQAEVGRVDLSLVL
ncbi:helix-turn-helix transcriptional regulator [Crossiella sp. CA-258035]|uniref:helix-turn-helix domain-containing protein n=1 Tax=Crossiella sp. CA-258035 TaxID=2981138 RepID=UPI0024BC31A4|nr:helix-turn-helix transcriptional regulator [Crossiella sp. CA-258035]WHT22552.1 helix-turn-helix transcriptional regulator [Crossiella sp. CA-258035]